MPLNGEIKWVSTGQVLWVRREEGCFWGLGWVGATRGLEGKCRPSPSRLGQPPDLQAQVTCSAAAQWGWELSGFTLPSPSPGCHIWGLMASYNFTSH